MKHTNLQAAVLGVSALFMGTFPFVGSPAAPQDPLLSEEDPPSTEDRSIAVQNGSFIASAPHYGPSSVARTVNVFVTAYNSLPEQTNGDPFITASGERTRHGIVAANFLPLGTKIRLPAIYGERVFIVTDRMHPRMQGYVDIWFEDYSEAIQFGKQRTYIEVLR
ncbi:MAG: hypothetical protein Q8P39_03165 [Candidatus Yanofskybacteria bacterium]|nr:hypothetical protein [Candidatus Yanofskybacteria bacterium]